MPDPMAPDEALKILMVAAAYDGREPSELQAGLWAADLNDAGIPVVDAVQAVRQHYRDRPDTYLKPGHVIAIARELIADRTRNNAAQAAIDAYDNPNTVDPRTVAPRILQMLADARARVAARGAQAAQNATERPGGPPGHPVPLQGDRDDLNGPRRRACQNDRDHAGGDWCPGWIVFLPGDPDAACDTCQARYGVYANTDPSCPRQDGWTNR